MKPIREKKHRLEPEIYIGEKIIPFTICIQSKKKFFIEEKLFKNFERILLDELNNFSCSAFVYLFMPDHVHLTLSGNDSNSNIKKCLDMFKQKTGFWFAKNHPDVKWQKIILIIF